MFQVNKRGNATQALQVFLKSRKDSEGKLNTEPFIINIPAMTIAEAQSFVQAMRVALSKLKMTARSKNIQVKEWYLITTFSEVDLTNYTCQITIQKSATKYKDKMTKAEEFLDMDWEALL